MPSFLLSLGKALSNFLPVDNFPDGLEIIGADVLVLQVVGLEPKKNDKCLMLHITFTSLTHVFPNINTKKWYMS